MSEVVIAERIVTQDGDYPNDDFSTVLSGNYDPNNRKRWDIVIDGPILKAESTNFPQYLTMMVRRRAVSQFKIDIDGQYSGLWVKLPGIPQASNSYNGWWDMGKIYDGFGVPNVGRNDNGCALGDPADGLPGVYTCTFGPESSANSQNNLIIVRIKMQGRDYCNKLNLVGMLVADSGAY